MLASTRLTVFCCLAQLLFTNALYIYLKVRVLRPCAYRGILLVQYEKFENATLLCLTLPRGWSSFFWSILSWAPWLQDNEHRCFTEILEPHMLWEGRIYVPAMSSINEFRENASKQKQVNAHQVSESMERSTFCNELQHESSFIEPLNFCSHSICIISDTRFESPEDRNKTTLRIMLCKVLFWHALSHI